MPRPQRIESSKWVLEVGRPAPIPRFILERHRLDLTPEQSRAGLWAVLLLLSPLTLVLAYLSVRLATRDWLSTGLALVPFGGAALCLGLLLLYLVGRRRLPQLCGRIAMVGCAAAVAGAGAYGAAGIEALAAARVGPPLRAQIVDVDGGGRGLRPTLVTFLLEDGSLAKARNYPVGPHSRAACYGVRRVTGRHGFSWLRVDAASPPPGPGGLPWPIDREDCFSPVPLPELRG